MVMFTGKVSCHPSVTVGHNSVIPIGMLFPLGVIPVILEKAYKRTIAKQTQIDRIG